MEYSSNAKGNLGVTLGAIGTGLGIIGNGAGILSGLNTNMSAGDVASIVTAVANVNNKCSENTPVTRYDMEMAMKLAAKDSEISLLKSEQNTEVKIADVYERIMTRVNADQRAQADWNAAQSVANAQMSAAIATNSNSIAALQNCCSQITKLVVPNTAICPGWGAVNVTPAIPTP